ncbi:MAG: hypoxanthine phosphoribosyltransferase [Planctomycetes bacterium]|nr:hypoxanthine phosphoribosyltransferase [Planctomycetota bacterium]
MTRSCIKIKDTISTRPLCLHHETCDDINEIVITSEQIQQTIQVLCSQIRDAYAEHTSVVVLFLLKGARHFAEDLNDALDDIKFKFVPIQVSSYGGGTRSTGQITISSNDMPDITGQSVLVLDDMYDSGLTLTRIKSHLEGDGAADVRACVMFEKDCMHTHEVSLDFVGLSVPDDFLVGYGLDYQDQYRELHCVGTLKPDVIASEDRHEDLQPLS